MGHDIGYYPLRTVEWTAEILPPSGMELFYWSLNNSPGNRQPCFRLDPMSNCELQRLTAINDHYDSRSNMPALANEIAVGMTQALCTLRCPPQVVVASHDFSLEHYRICLVGINEADRAFERMCRQ